MKALKHILLLFLLTSVFSSMKGTAGIKSQPGNSVSFQTFYDELSPYGRWVNYDHYGSVWIPDVDDDFQPYGTNGQWVVTEYGNTWVSDYEWGWAPFHYGRWINDDYYGWIWVPGSEWGPAWVNWRSGGGYYGWAPLGPGLDINININIPLSRWIFVPRRYITHRSVYNYCLPRNRYSHVYGHTTVINNIYINNNRRYFSGPDRRDMERATRSRIHVHNVYASNRPGKSVTNRGSLNIYRPEVRDRANERSDRYNSNNTFNRRPSTDRINPVTSRRTSPRQDASIGDNNQRKSTDRITRPVKTNDNRSSEKLDRSRRTTRTSDQSTRMTTEGRTTTRPNYSEGRNQERTQAEARPSRPAQTEQRAKGASVQSRQREVSRPAQPERNQNSDNSRSRGSSSDRPTRSASRLTKG